MLWKDHMTAEPCLQDWLYDTGMTRKLALHLEGSTEEVASNTCYHTQYDNPAGAISAFQVNAQRQK